jgi:hypothetical protein
MYLYAVKQVSLQEFDKTSKYPTIDTVCVQLLKIDTYIEISNHKIVKSKFGQHLEFDIISNKGENKTICFKRYDLAKCIIFNTLEEVKAHQEKELAKDKCKYIVKYKGENYKDKKYKRVTDIFCSLMSDYGYYGLFYDSLNEENTTKNPELDSINDFPYWCDTSHRNRNKDLNELKDFTIHKYFGAKKPTEQIEYDLYTKISKNFNTLHLALEYGLCVKDLYSKIESVENSDMFKYILVFTPDNYEKNWEILKEDISIKANLKGIPSSNYIKSTKYGKTAIAFNDMSDLVTFFFKFDADIRDKEYIKMFTMDEGKQIACNGDASLFILDKALDSILAI